MLSSHTYAVNHSDWDECSRQANELRPSFFQMIFGSCSGVVNAASHAFSTSQPCNVGKETNFHTRLRSRRNRSPSLRKSEELIEIPEFLAADLEDDRDKNVSPADDVSALSSLTLEEMAKQNGYTENLAITSMPKMRSTFAYYD